MKKHKNIIKLLSKTSFFVLILFLLVLSIAYIPNHENIIGASISATTWHSNLSDIKQATNSESYRYYSIRDYVNFDVDSNQNKTISSIIDPENHPDPNKKIDFTNLKGNKIVILINDGYDLYLFSEVCNHILTNKVENQYYSKYLKLNYTLGADIDYELASQKYKMFRPIGWENENHFSGVFDGRGYTIKNLFFYPYNNVNEYNEYNGNMANLGLFANNKGTIKNLGLINVNNIQLDKFGTANSASPLFGNNSGTIENCFVQDLRGGEAGFLCEGGFIITMFGGANTGIIRNCYVAVNRIKASSVAMTTKQQQYPFVISTDKPLDNCFYDKQIIDGSSYNTTDKIDNLQAINTNDFQTNTAFVGENSVWYTKHDYTSEYQSYFSLQYPILKGLKLVKDGQGKPLYFEIKSAVDLVYMSELVSKYKPFRSSNFKLMKSIDMASVKPNSYVVSRSVFTGTFDGGPFDVNDPVNVELVNKTRSEKNSILNLSINKGVSYNGLHCYGLFPILAGTVKNINIVDAVITENDLSTPNYNEPNSIGTICGLLEGGTIEDVNVKTTINLDVKEALQEVPAAVNDTNIYLGVQYAGGICGTITKGHITNATTSGMIYSPVYDISNVGTSFKGNHSIGGIVGRSECEENTIEFSIKNCLNNLTITAPTYLTKSNTRQFIGGVIGSGPFKNVTQIQNNAKITLPSNNYNAIMYIGGVIGRVEQSYGVNGEFFNNGDIEYNVNDRNTKAYISGIMNVESNTALKYDTFTTNATADTIINELAQLKPLEFKSLSNGGILIYNNALTNSLKPSKYFTIDSSGVTIDQSIDIRTAGIAYSYLTSYNVIGAYNLNYHYEMNNGTLEKITGRPQEVDISMIDEFGPTFNADNKVTLEQSTKKIHLDTNTIISKSDIFNKQANKDIETKIKLERVYNYRNLIYTTNKNVLTYMLQLSGSINGRNFDLKNIRNDGNIKVYFKHDTHIGMKTNEATYQTYFKDYKKMKVYGVMEEVSVGCKAVDIYNGGDITISSATGIVPNFNLYISGICYKNVGNDIIDKTLMIKKGYIGSLHNCINNGDIRITSGDIISTNQTAGGNFYSQSRIGGICSVNCSTISATFNLGNVYNINNVIEPNDTYGSYVGGNFEVETGGICFNMQNEQLKKLDAQNRNIVTSANIIDSANNGTIISMNSGTKNGWVNAGGFIGRNDRGEDNETVNANSSSKNPHLQKIQYSINYGDVISYNEYVEDNRNEQQAKASGFICLGACTLVDVINYGNVYGSRVASGIFGYLMMERMNAAGASKSSPIYIANAINYGAINTVPVNTNNSNQLKNENKEKILETGKTSSNSSSSVSGAFIGMMSDIKPESNWGGNKNKHNEILESLNIKYLVNFDSNSNVLGGTYNVSGNTNIPGGPANWGRDDDVNNPIDGTFDTAILQKIMENMATTKDVDTSPIPFQKASNNSSYGIKSYSYDTKAPNPNAANKFSKEANGGIYNENYSLRTPHTPTLDAQGNLNLNDTDNFISDYIQFIPYSKVNDELVRKIKLESVVLTNAYENSKKNYLLINSLLKQKYQGTVLDDKYSEIIGKTSVDLNNCKNEILLNLEEEFSRRDSNGKLIYTDIEIKEILKILLQNNNGFTEVTTLTDVKPIIKNLVNGMSVDNVRTVISEIVGSQSNLQNMIQNNSTDFYIYVGFILSDDTKYQSIHDLYNALATNDVSIDAYIASLTPTDKTKLANEIYPWLQENQNIKDALANSYPNIEFTTQEEVTSLINKISDSQNNTVQNISTAEYSEMYKGILSNKYTTTEATAYLNSINDATTLNGLIDQIINACNSNNNLLNDLTNTRESLTGIILKATADRYLEIINKNDFSIVTKANSSTIYSGGFSDLDSTKPANKVEIIVNIGGTADQKGNYYYFWKKDSTANDSYILKRKKNSPSGHAMINKSSSNGSSGVYAIETAANYSNYSKNFNYEKIQITTYIDYGGNNSRDTNPNLKNAVTTEMFNQMKLESVVSTANFDIIKTYLINIYNNSSNKTILNNVIKDYQISKINSNNPLTKEQIGFIRTKTDLTNYKFILDNISDQTIQQNILNEHIAKNGYSSILKQLLQQLATIDLTNPNAKNKLKAILPKLYETGANKIYNDTTLIDSVISIINDLSIDKQNQFISQFIDIFNLYSSILQKEYTNLSREDNILIIKSRLNQDISLAKNPNLINNHNIYNFKASIAASIIKTYPTLFVQYIDDGSNMNKFIEDVKKTGLDLASITDFTGIYALASSYGIEDGLFIPDNISLIDLDPIIMVNGELKNDPTWRGGKPGQPDFIDPINPNKDTVNYKIYREMKQLKLSIATKVFNMEIIGADENDNIDVNTIVNNNIETDYFFNEPHPGTDQTKYTEINFYVPLNHDILNKKKILIHEGPIGNENSFYELSYGATLDKETDAFVIDLTNVTLNVGDSLHDTFVVQAEDKTVKTTYTLNVYITDPSYFEYTKGKVTVNGSQTATDEIKGRQVPNTAITINDIKVTTKVNGYNGNIRVEYLSKNMANKLDLTKFINLYKLPSNVQLTTFQNDIQGYINDQNLLNNKNFAFDESEPYNGIVHINLGKDEPDSGFNSSTNTYKDGKFVINLKIDNNLEKGFYAFEIVLNSKFKYYVLFEKAASTRATVEKIVYNQKEVLNLGQEGSNVSNETNPSTHKFGTPLTKQQLMQSTTDPNTNKNKPNYLDEFVIAPLATYRINNATFSVAGGKVTYKIEYLITSESGATQTFTHFITEDNYNKNLQTVYKDDGVVYNNETNEQKIYVDSFSKKTTPSYRFEYDLSGFYSDPNNPRFHLKKTDVDGNVIGDATAYHNITQNITQGIDFEVSFPREAEAQTYYFKMVYENSAFNFDETITNNTTNQINWKVEFDLVTLTKEKNKDSQLTNITFTSESVIASTKTFITTKPITPDSYQQQVDSSNKEIVCLPGKIYYNNYEYHGEGQRNPNFDSSEFKVIGVVSKTRLEFYSPIFELPEGAKVYRTTTIGTGTSAEIYKYVPYYTGTDKQTLKTFLVSEDNLKIKTEDGNDVVTNTNGIINTFNYNGAQYTISEVAGYSSIKISGTTPEQDITIQNTSLMTDYGNNPDPTNFKYIDYKVYAENFDINQTAEQKKQFSTIYKISTQDISNNIRFKISITKEKNCDIDLKCYSVYLELICYSLIDGKTDNVDHSKLGNTDTIDETIYNKHNRLGLFAYFEEGATEVGGNIPLTFDPGITNNDDKKTIQSNTNGWYLLNITLPKGYIYTYTVDGQTPNKKFNNQFFITSSIVAKTVEIEIVIKNGEIDLNNEWGQHIENDSIIKNPTPQA